MRLLTIEEIRLLTEVGFIAAGKGDVRRAECIFGVLLRLRPQRAFAHIGLAMVYLNANRSDEAVMILENARNAVDAADQGEIDAFRGLALQLAGRTSESQRALRMAGPVRMAQIMLGELTSTSAMNHFEVRS